MRVLGGWGDVGVFVAIGKQHREIWKINESGNQRKDNFLEKTAVLG